MSPKRLLSRTKKKLIGGSALALKEGMKVYTDSGEICAVFYTVKRRATTGRGRQGPGYHAQWTWFLPRRGLQGMRMLFTWDVISFILLLPIFI